MTKLPAKPGGSDLTSGPNLLQLALEGLKPNTLRAYAADWAKFAAHCHAEPQDFFGDYLALLRTDRGRATLAIRRYRDFLIQGGSKPKTVARRIGGVRAIIARLHSLDDTRFPLPPQCPVPTPKRKRDVSGPTGAQWRALMRAVQEQVDAGATLAIRDMAILRCLRDGAIRRGEIVSVRYPDDVVTVGRGRSWRLELAVIQKGDIGSANAERVQCPIGKRASAAVLAWLEARGRAPGWLFPGRDGEGLSPDAINALCAKWSALAGFHLNPHALRHAGITEAARKHEGPLTALTRFARHSNPATTMLYVDHVDGAEAKIADLVGDDDE